MKPTERIKLALNMDDIRTAGGNVTRDVVDARYTPRLVDTIGDAAVTRDSMGEIKDLTYKEIPRATALLGLLGAGGGAILGAGSGLFGEAPGQDGRRKKILRRALSGALLGGGGGALLAAGSGLGYAAGHGSAAQMLGISLYPFDQGELGPSLVERRDLLRSL